MNPTSEIFNDFKDLAVGPQLITKILFGDLNKKFKLATTQRLCHT
jgi:hypothetical protein